MTAIMAENVTQSINIIGIKSDLVLNIDLLFTQSLIATTAVINPIRHPKAPNNRNIINLISVFINYPPL